MDPCVLFSRERRSALFLCFYACLMLHLNGNSDTMYWRKKGEDENE